MRNLWLLLGLCFSVLNCGSSAGPCKITADIVPASATADHAAAPPGNEVQFSLQSSVSGDCPLVADKVGVWSSSDPTTVPVNSEGLATCQNGSVAVVATITNSSTVRGKSYSPATLSCE